MTQTFCRHNRFIQRCPICRQTLPGQESPRHASGPKASSTATRAGAARNGSSSRSTRSARVPSVRVHREVRSEDDGYRSELAPGLHSSHDAQQLVAEIGFASGRLLTLTAAPPSLYAEARDCDDIEQATWMCFLAAYLSPLRGSQSFVGVRQALLSDWASGGLPELEDVPLGPRTCHDPARGAETLLAYRRFAAHAGSQEQAFGGEPSWTPQRRFERLFERLALPGFGRVGRYELLITLGRLGLYELRADSLHLISRTGRPAAQQAEDRTLLSAKRVFGIGDPTVIERRAQTLAHAISVPIEALELALANWGSEERMTLGFPLETNDVHAVERASAALEV